MHSGSSAISSASQHCTPIPGLAALWRQTLGDPRVTIAVLDGPVDRCHPSLTGADLTTVRTLVPADAADGPATAHGTHVTSVIFGQHERGVVRGIAPLCRGLIVPIFASSGESAIAPCSQIDLARAIIQAAIHGANIINVSAGQLAPSGEAFPILRDAVRYCRENGILIVSAVGNDGCPCVHVPGALPEVLAVGAMDQEGRPLEFSNWGEAYRASGILAPGAEVLGAAPGGGAVRHSGTSFATAIVSGVAALLLGVLRRRDRSAHPHVVRAAILKSAITCAHHPIPDCRRLLVGRLNIAGALSIIQTGGNEMSETISTDQAPPVAPVSPSEILGTADTVADDAPPAVQAATAAPTAADVIADSEITGPTAAVAPAAVEAPVTPTAPTPPEASPDEAVNVGLVAPSACSCGGGGGGPAAPPPLVYAIGELGTDFGTEARRDSFLQRDVTNPHDAAQLLAHLEHDPWDAASVIWTLNHDATPIYAVYPAGAFARRTYERLCQALGEQLSEGVERISVPGFVSGKVRLLNGQTVPVILPELRGLYSWSTTALIKAVGAEGDEAQAARLRNFLHRIYYELRNLGLTPQDRAMNYAATNAFQAHQVFEQSGKENLELDSIEVERSPICRPESDCWDVKLTFFDPTNRFERARHVHRFTVDVSDVIPVTVGEVRHWNVY